MRKMRKRVFIAGPFRATSAWEVEKNIRNAEAVALAVDRAGGAAFCPHTNSRFFSGAADDSVWLELDLEWLAVSEAVLVLPGSESSSGTKGEIAEADNLGIPIFRAETVSEMPDVLPSDFRKWLRKPRG